MVKLNNSFNQNCEVSLKSDLRRSLDAVNNLDASDMGNQESMQQHQLCPISLKKNRREEDHLEVPEIVERDLKLLGLGKTKYSAEEIMGLRDLPLAKMKPKCADDKPYWVDGKPFRKYC